MNAKHLFVVPILPASGWSFVAASQSCHAQPIVIHSVSVQLPASDVSFPRGRVRTLLANALSVIPPAWF